MFQSPRGTGQQALWNKPILEIITLKTTNVTKCKKNENKLFIIIIIIIIHLKKLQLVKKPWVLFKNNHTFYE